MWKVLMGILVLLIMIAMIPVAVIALSAPSSPPPMASIARPLSRVNFDDVPVPEHFQARDGTRLQYYAYPAGPGKTAVLVQKLRLQGDTDGLQDHSPVENRLRTF